MGGGWGHLTRATALARAAQPYAPAAILTNSPYAAWMPPSPDPAADPAVYIVDTFPRGVRGELAHSLPALRAKKVLVHRDLNPDYVEWAGLRDFVARTYDLVLIPGPDEGGAFADLPQARVTPPWLIRSAAELPRSLGGEGILICAAGNAAELAWYGQVAQLLPEARCVAATPPPGCPPERWLRYWPALDLIAAADVVIGGAGYNTVYECLACGVPLIARPWPRQYDRQRRRAERAASAVVETPRQAAAAAGKLRGTRTAVPFVNGVEQAAALIAALLQ